MYTSAPAFPYRQNPSPMFDFSVPLPSTVIKQTAAPAPVAASATPFNFFHHDANNSNNRLFLNKMDGNNRAAKGVIRRDTMHDFGLGSVNASDRNELRRSVEFSSPTADNSRTFQNEGFRNNNNNNNNNNNSNRVSFMDIPAIHELVSKASSSFDTETTGRSLSALLTSKDLYKATTGAEFSSRIFTFGESTPSSGLSSPNGQVQQHYLQQALQQQEMSPTRDLDVFEMLINQSANNSHHNINNNNNLRASYSSPPPPLASPVRMGEAFQEKVRLQKLRDDLEQKRWQQWRIQRQQQQQQHLSAPVQYINPNADANRSSTSQYSYSYNNNNNNNNSTVVNRSSSSNNYYEPANNNQVQPEINLRYLLYGQFAQSSSPPPPLQQQQQQQRPVSPYRNEISQQQQRPVSPYRNEISQQQTSMYQTAPHDYYNNPSNDTNNNRTDLTPRAHRTTTDLFNNRRSPYNNNNNNNNNSGRSSSPNQRVYYNDPFFESKDVNNNNNNISSNALSSVGVPRNMGYYDGSPQEDRYSRHSPQQQRSTPKNRDIYLTAPAVTSTASAFSSMTPEKRDFGEERGFVDNYMFPAPPSSYSTDEYIFREHLVWFPVDPRIVGVGYTPGYFQRTPSASHVVIFMHSNAVDLGIIQPTVSAFAKRWHVHILAVEYPGYGVCGGLASESSVNAVARAAMKFLHRKLQVPYSRMILYGSSIGTGPATRLAAEMCSEGHHPAALILQSPYLSIKHLVEHLVASALAIFVSERFDNGHWIRQVSCPTLIIHGQEDRITPWFHAEELFRRCPAQGKALYGPQSVGHDNLDFDRHIVRPVNEFLSQKVQHYASLQHALDLNENEIAAAKVAMKASEQKRDSVLGVTLL